MITSDLFGAAMRKCGASLQLARLVVEQAALARRPQGRAISRSPRRTRDRRSLLSAAFEKESIQQQQNHRADDLCDEAGRFSRFVPANGPTEISGDDRTGDAEQNRNDATTGISSRHQQLCDRADDQTNKTNPN